MKKYLEILILAFITLTSTGNLQAQPAMSNLSSNLPLCPQGDMRGWGHCFGTSYYPNGNFYTGEFINGLRDGFGTLRIVAIGTSTDRYIASNIPATYVGEFRNDQISGHGVWSDDDGGRYEGEFVNNMMVNSPQLQQQSYQPPPHQIVIDEYIPPPEYVIDGPLYYDAYPGVAFYPIFIDYPGSCFCIMPMRFAGGVWLGLDGLVLYRGMFPYHRAEESHLFAWRERGGRFNGMAPTRGTFDNHGGHITAAPPEGSLHARVIEERHAPVSPTNIRPADLRATSPQQLQQQTRQQPQVMQQQSAPLQVKQEQPSASRQQPPVVQQQQIKPKPHACSPAEHDAKKC